MPYRCPLAFIFFPPGSIILHPLSLILSQPSDTMAVRTLARLFAEHEHNIYPSPHEHESRARHALILSYCSPFIPYPFAFILLFSPQGRGYQTRMNVVLRAFKEASI